MVDFQCFLSGPIVLLVGPIVKVEADQSVWVPYDGIALFECDLMRAVVKRAVTKVPNRHLFKQRDQPCRFIG
jgi:hypothetical protein